MFIGAEYKKWSSQLRRNENNENLEKIAIKRVPCKFVCEWPSESDLCKHLRDVRCHTLPCLMQQR